MWSIWPARLDGHLAPFRTRDIWQWDAFSAMGAMTGLHVGLVALLVGFRDTKAWAPARFERPQGKAAMRAIMQTAWAWFAPATIALVHIVAPLLVLEVALVVTTAYALGASVSAYIAVSALLEPFTE